MLLVAEEKVEAARSTAELHVSNWDGLSTYVAQSQLLALPPAQSQLLALPPSLVPGSIPISLSHPVRHACNQS